MAVRLSYRRTLAALVASVLLLKFYAGPISEFTGFKGTTCGMARTCTLQNNIARNAIVIGERVHCAELE